MILGVMQPYLFPYIGYYQLVYYSDEFIFYDDVNFIKGGYINRNSILAGSKKHLFTLSLVNSSSYKKINQVLAETKVRKLEATIRQNYSKAPMFDAVYPLVESVLNSTDRNIAHIAACSISVVAEYLNFNTAFKVSSNLDYDRNLTAQDRLISLCESRGATVYCNPVGGVDLYDKNIFKKNAIELQFLKKNSLSYCQGNVGFVDGLSMIDVLMWNDKASVIAMLKDFSIH